MMRFALLLAVLGACTKDNPYYMRGDAGGSGSDAAVSCSATNDTCSALGKLCNTTSGKCVMCLSTNAGCSGTTPVCNTTADTCGACTMNQQCTSNLCLPNGACGDDSTVAYVSNSGSDSNACTMSMPCATIAHAATVHSYVKVESDLTQQVTLTDQSVTILGGGHKLTYNGSTPAIAVVSTVSQKTVEIRDLIIAATSGTSDGINVAANAKVDLILEHVTVDNFVGLGITMLGGKLTMRRSIVSNNDNGGINVNNAAVDITNTIIAKNGGTGSTIGGVSLLLAGTSNVFAFNTVATNSSATASGRGIACSNTYNIVGTILFDNLSVPNCSFTYSLFDATAPSGTGNKVGQPSFKNVTDSFGADYYRINSNSDAIDSAGTSTLVTNDIDGQTRTGTFDIGADEYQP